MAQLGATYPKTYPMSHPNMEHPGVPDSAPSVEMPKRRVLNVCEKIELIKLIDSSPLKKKHIAAAYGIPLNTLSTIYSNRERLLKRSESDFTNLNQKRIRASSYPEVEEALLNWYKQNYALKTDEKPSGNSMREFALKVAKSLGIENFSASNGWIERFKVRHNLKIHRYKKKNKSSVNINTHNGDPYFDLNKSDVSRNGNSSETECFNDVESNVVWENVSNPVMELTELKQECDDSHNPDYGSQNSVLPHRVSDNTYSHVHIVPDSHIETQSIGEHCDVSPRYLGSERRECDISLQDVEEAYGVIRSYIQSIRNNVNEKTLEAMKEIKRFISNEKDKKTQTKITDYFTVA